MSTLSKWVSRYEEQREKSKARFWFKEHQAMAVPGSWDQGVNRDDLKDDGGERVENACVVKIGRGDRI